MKDIVVYLTENDSDTDTVKYGKIAFDQTKKFFNTINKHLDFEVELKTNADRDMCWITGTYKKYKFYFFINYFYDNKTYQIDYKDIIYHYTIGIDKDNIHSDTIESTLKNINDIKSVTKDLDASIAKIS